MGPGVGFGEAICEGPRLFAPPEGAQGPRLGHRSFIAEHPLREPTVMFVHECERFGVVVCTQSGLNPAQELRFLGKGGRPRGLLVDDRRRFGATTRGSPAIGG